MISRFRTPVVQQVDPVTAKKKIYATGAFKKIGHDCLFGKEKVGLVVHVEAAGEFYVQINDFAEDFQRIIADMNDYYCRPNSEELKLTDFNKGLPCAAQFSEDNVWYRAKIRSYAPKNRMLNVFFVDYGNEDILSADGAKFLKNDFFVLPSLAIRCRLANVRPKSPDVWWSSASTDDLKTFTGRPIAIRFVKFDVDHIWQVDLISEIAGNMRNSVCSRFVSKGFAEFYESPPIEVKHLAAATVPLVVDLPEGFVLPNVTYDTEHTITIVHFRSLDEFYVTFTDSLDALTNFERSISSIYDSNMVPSCANLLPINSGCVSFISNTWCRCEITDLPNDNHPNQCRLFRVDYGDDSLENVDNIYPVVDSGDYFMSKTPRFTFCCRMKGVKTPRDPADRRNLFIKMMELSDNRPCIIYRIDENNRFEVDLFVKNGSTVANFLLHEHLACYAAPSAPSNDRNVFLASSNEHKSLIQPFRAALSSVVEPSKNYNVSDSSVTSMQVENLPVWKCEKIAKNSYADVHIVHVDDASKFHVIMSDEYEKFIKMEESLAKSYNDPANIHLPLVSPSSGNVCVGQFTNASKWCRCFVVTRNSPAVIQVYLYDYGRFELISKGNLKVLDDVFRLIPPFSLQCSLKGVPVDYGLTSEFKKIVQDPSCSFVLRFDDKNLTEDSYEVTLYVAQHRNMHDINELLKNSFSLSRQSTFSAKAEQNFSDGQARQRRDVVEQKYYEPPARQRRWLEGPNK